MSREIDRRDFNQRRTILNRDADLRSLALAVSDRLPGAHRIRIGRFDGVTGNPAAVASEAAPAEAGNYVQRAVDHVRGISRALGLTATQPVEFVADPDFQTTSSGAVAVHLQQAYKGILIFQAAEVVRFEANGAIKETVGSAVTVPEDVAVAVAPTIKVQEAVLRAARHVAVPMFAFPHSPPLLKSNNVLFDAEMQHPDRNAKAVAVGGKEAEGLKAVCKSALKTRPGGASP